MTQGQGAVARGEREERVAPCGLVCRSCAVESDGEPGDHGRELAHFRETFLRYVATFAAYDRGMAMHAARMDLLQLLTDANYEGGSGGTCKLRGCAIAPCARKRGYEHCFECPSFPCDGEDFEPLLREKWVAANQRMRDVGVAAYLEDVENVSHDA